jgi:hypothetical protein
MSFVTVDQWRLRRRVVSVVGAEDVRPAVSTLGSILGSTKDSVVGEEAVAASHRAAEVVHMEDLEATAMASTVVTKAMAVEAGGTTLDKEDVDGRTQAGRITSRRCPPRAMQDIL